VLCACYRSSELVCFLFKCFSCTNSCLFLVHNLGFHNTLCVDTYILCPREVSAKYQVLMILCICISIMILYKSIIPTLKKRNQPRACFFCSRGLDLEPMTLIMTSTCTFGIAPTNQKQTFCVNGLEIYRMTNMYSYTQTTAKILPRYTGNSKKLSYRWQTARRESCPLQVNGCDLLAGFSDFYLFLSPLALSIRGIPRVIAVIIWQRRSSFSIPNIIWYEKD